MPLSGGLSQPIMLPHAGTGTGAGDCCFCGDGAVFGGEPGREGFGVLCGWTDARRACSADRKSTRLNSSHWE